MTSYGVWTDARMLVHQEATLLACPVPGVLGDKVYTVEFNLGPQGVGAS